MGIILVVAGLVTGTAKATTGDPVDAEPSDVETPHMPGPTSD